MTTPTNFRWIMSLPAGTILALAAGDDDLENIGFACPRFVFIPTRLEPRGELRNWAIDNDIECQECPVRGGYALVPGGLDQSFAIRMRWGGA